MMKAEGLEKDDELSRKKIYITGSLTLPWSQRSMFAKFAHRFLGVKEEKIRFLERFYIKKTSSSIFKNGFRVYKMIPKQALACKEKFFLDYSASLPWTVEEVGAVTNSQEEPHVVRYDIKNSTIIEDPSELFDLLGYKQVIE